MSEPQENTRLLGGMFDPPTGRSGASDRATKSARASAEKLLSTQNSECRLPTGLEGDGISRAGRKRLFSSQQNLAAFTYRTDRVYSWDFYQNMINPNSFELELPFAHLNLSKYLNHHPILIMAKNTQTNQYLWTFEVWHTNLLTQDHVSSLRK